MSAYWKYLLLGGGIGSCLAGMFTGTHVGADIASLIMLWMILDKLEPAKNHEPN